MCFALRLCFPFFFCVCLFMCLFCAFTVKQSDERATNTRNLRKTNKMNLLTKLIHFSYEHFILLLLLLLSFAETTTERRKLKKINRNEIYRERREQSNLLYVKCELYSVRTLHGRCMCLVSCTCVNICFLFRFCIFWGLDTVLCYIRNKQQNRQKKKINVFT